MSIIIEPLGGLGNQLFVYALGLRLAQDHGTELVCDTWRFHRYRWHIYELDTFTNSISRTYSSRSREVFGKKSRRAMKGAVTFHLMPARIGRLVIERDSTFDPRLLTVPNGSRLSGYFQSLRYFSPIIDEVRSQVTQPIAPSQWMMETRSRLAELGEWVAVHVRRGNYTQIAAMGLVDEHYYRRAIAHVDQMVGELPLVVFSDSPELVSSMSPFANERTFFVDAPVEVRAIDALQVMSDASHVIMGNSTFSWWAGLLRDQPGRLVIAPRPWLDDKRFNERDLLPPDWITLGRGESS